jgi:RluA family pseudouridine synthase
VVGPEDAGRLDGLVLAWLAEDLGRPLSKAIVRRLVMAGLVRVNGRPAPRPGLVVPAGARLDAAIDETRLPAPEAAGARATPVRVLYEDAALIAVDKPPGLAVHATADASRADLYTLVRRQLSGETGSGGVGDAYLGLHHRLDRDTSGIVLFTKRPEANAGLARQFEARTIEKTYHAITARPSGTVARTWRVRDRLAQAGSGRASRVVRSAGSGQVADTSFAIVERFRSALLVEARPHTGRKHQVRAHLSGSGLPIAGDTRYGGPGRLASLVVSRPLLHAWRIVLDHPLTGARLRIDCEYPDDFASVLRVLRAASAAHASRAGGRLP